jgi:hypothetical protein
MFVALLALVGCGPPAAIQNDAEQVTWGDPEIVASTLDCSLKDEEWFLSIETNSWAGGGVLLMTVDGMYVESHAVFSVGAASDGTYDNLSVTLAIMADWRDVSEGSSTAFLCAEEVAALFKLESIEGELVECAYFGADSVLFDLSKSRSDCPGSQ